MSDSISVDLLLQDIREIRETLKAAKAEIALLRNTIGWKASVAYRAEIAALTEQRDRLIELGTQWRVERDRVTEQRDREMKVVEAARGWADARRAAINECTPSTVDRLAKAEGDLAATVRALDAEATTE